MTDQIADTHDVRTPLVQLAGWSLGNPELPWGRINVTWIDCEDAELAIAAKKGSVGGDVLDALLLAADILDDAYISISDDVTGQALQIAVTGNPTNDFSLLIAGEVYGPIRKAMLARLAGEQRDDQLIWTLDPDRLRELRDQLTPALAGR